MYGISWILIVSVIGLIAIVAAVFIFKRYNIITFLVHCIIAGILLALSWFSMTFAPRPGSSELLLAKAMVPGGILIIIMSFNVLAKKSFRAYLWLFAVTLIAIISWMIIEAAMDMKIVLGIYLLIMLPLLSVKYKQTRQTQ